ncbi:hypothetical protein [Actinomadura flavalba]|uniref:hypothetical protein n=1 Tax=Actinomadura flavalba TaxID=1120938 RepID=UPI000377EA62|nr:hypothetical protein [Actinomadura flavalba]
MLPYAAYLRVYEPVSAFPEPERTVWTAYAESRRRPSWARSLAAEHRAALLRLVAEPAAVAPDRESRDAYVRRIGDTIYVAPWATRLRCWLAYARFRDGAPGAPAAAVVAPDAAARAAEGFERWSRAGRARVPHIREATWRVPGEWFVPFAGTERCLVLREEPADPGESPGGAAATAAPARTLLYVTSMAEARRRVADALPVLTEAPAGAGFPVTEGRLAELERWLAGFHPGGLVELDYGGLVHLLDDGALSADASVAETGVALAALRRGERELAVAMAGRLTVRWRRVRALESAN